MFAKTLMAIAAYVAFAPHSGNLIVKLMFSALSVGVLSGLVGTATREQPATMIPVNAGEAALVAVAVTIVLHVATAQLHQRKRSA